MSSTLLTLIDNAVTSIKPFNHVVAWIADKALPTVVAKACQSDPGCSPLWTPNDCGSYCSDHVYRSYRIVWHMAWQSCQGCPCDFLCQTCQLHSYWSC